MRTLARDLRKQLENTVKDARRIAEGGAHKALEQLAVHHHEPWPSLTPKQRGLRNRLRAHGRQLGDQRDERRGTQVIARLKTECAYEHWHRMLFARFLAETALLIEPETGVAISLAECQELARERGEDWLELASTFAERMLPQVFRKGDPVLEVALPPETRSKLEDLLKDLPRSVFLADDSLGWVYQFWQAERKDQVNAAGSKIGADELPAVTQLFTEDYMVDFLLDNTLGAWHAGKMFASNPKLPENAESEDEIRQAVALPGCPWKYLRFIQGKDGQWTPAAGTFEGWPKTAKDFKCLDPCMGSGHFVVAMFERLVALRLAEENLDEAPAVAAVIRDNLFGLEIDPRCTQIGAFNLALAAWRRVGHCTLPAMNLACSGLAPNTREADWLAIAGDNQKLQRGMERLYRLFQKAAGLGSLINPRAGEGDLLVAAFHELQPLLETALAQEAKDDTAHEMAVTARGLAKAAEILAGQFTLVATNVPFLGRKNQNVVLATFCAETYPEAKLDLATCFLMRCLTLSARSGTVSLVMPQSPLFLASYKQFRRTLLGSAEWNVVARLGEHGFESSAAAGGFTALLTLTARRPEVGHACSCAIDVAAQRGEQPIYADAKPMLLKEKQLVAFRQTDLLKSPDAAVVFGATSDGPLLSRYAASIQGASTLDIERFALCFWEVTPGDIWLPHQSTPIGGSTYSGLQFVSISREPGGAFEALAADLKAEGRLGGAWSGQPVWGKRGVACAWMGTLPAAIYMGVVYDNSIAAIVPHEEKHLLPIWCYCSSASFQKEVRKINQKTQVANATLVKVPFDLAHWQKVAAEKYPHGLPQPFSSDPTQWLFNGHPKGAGASRPGDHLPGRGAPAPLHVAVARLLGYRWPRQTGSSFPDCPALGPDGLEKLADHDGIVCLPPVRGEAPAAERLRQLLAVAFGKEWKAQTELELIRASGCGAADLEEWLRNDFFAQHCSIFHQRPFVWHVWDGRRDGFNALANYHKLAGTNGDGRRTLEKLIYTYLGDWIDRQRADQRSGIEGADARLAAAEHLKTELERILAGEPPYDIFVRWKPLRQQPIGWEPDINDGVRINIRPFMMARPLGARGANACILRTTPRINWGKDRGKEPQRDRDEFPWFWGWDEEAVDFAGGKHFDGNRWNDLHYTIAFKQAARERQRAGRKP
ncbi:MAG: SAM-dependent DNA methyltransferase [Deltaproteobacteria bacterium]|nr:SAM-dependent DNA methyltransferase [Deltaproteobacteria bacterium]